MRVQTLAKEARLKFIVTEKKYASLWTGMDQLYQTICVDIMPDNAMEIENILIDNSMVNDLAYVLYTSGSTGRPKGVRIQHKAVNNLLQAQKKYFKVMQSDRVLQFANIGFDPSVWEWTTALLNGACLVLMDNPSLMNHQEIFKLLYENAITIASIPPVLLREFKYQLIHSPEEMLQNQQKDLLVLPMLKTLIVGGDVCDVDVLGFWAKNRMVFNTYGPTEATVFAILSLYEIGDLARQIGLPIDNVKAYVLDENLKSVLKGEIGGLYLSGECLSSGYLNNPQITAENFIDNPFWDGQSAAFAKMYKTGDMVKINRQGFLEYIGRCDNQVKIRGMRVELDEIKYVIDEHPLVKNSTVVLDEQQNIMGFIEKIRGVSVPLNPQETQIISNEIVNSWRHLYENVYNQSISDTRQRTSAYFNTIGWQSSYTGDLMSEQEMLEWRDNTAARILALKPQRVLEIGCGTGMLLFKIAPYCQHYVATDFSQAAIDGIEKQLPSVHLQQIVQLQKQDAEIFKSQYQQAFDVVIINSVVQYFSNQTYLTRVLDNAVQYIKGSGVVFIGDVRSYAHFEPFCALAAWHKKHQTAMVAELHQYYQQLLHNEKELLVHHEYFYQLAKQRNAIDYVELNLKQGSFVNEMNQFRYDVLLHINSKVESKQENILLETYTWNTLSQAKRSLSAVLANNADANDAVVVTGIPNQRLRQSHRVLKWLRNNISIESDKFMQDGCDPTKLFDLADRYGYYANVYWSSNGSVYHLDAIFSKKTQTRKVLRYIYQQRTRDNLNNNHDELLLTNHPSVAAYRQLIKQKLYQYLRLQLPDYMADIQLFVLEQLPLTLNNKLDRQKLLAIAKEQKKSLKTTTNDPIEQVIIKIWQEVLGCVNIAPNDNFFELGGHSLAIMKIWAQLNQHFKVRLNLRDLFSCSTLRQLAELIKLNLSQSAIPATKDNNVENQDRKIAVLG